jgi:hypothetical protein
MEMEAMITGEAVQAVVIQLVVILVFINGILLKICHQKTHKNSKGANAKKAIINYYNGDMDGCWMRNSKNRLEIL